MSRPIDPAVRRGLGWRWLAVLLPGVLIWVIPWPGLTSPQRHLLAVFVATISALVAHPVPMGVSALTAMTFLAVADVVSPQRVLAGFANLTVWLVFSAFLFARAVTVTQLGQRIAFLFINRFGKSTLSLGYSLVAADVALAPFIPSDTARGGSIMYPICRSVAEAAGSSPGPTARHLGAFLILASFHATYTASATFLTGMAANPLIAEFASKLGQVELTWLRWLLGASVPALLTFVFMPLLLHRLVRPSISDTEPARAHARASLAGLGPPSSAERRLVVVMLLVVTGWITSPQHGIPNAFVALAGVSALLLGRVLTWEDLLGERRAWDALIWFATLVMMASELQETGIIGVLSSSLFAGLQSWSWVLAFPALLIAYLYIHYGFASMTAHVTALYPGFIAAALVAGAPPLVAALGLAYFSNLNASLTHYGTASAPIFFSAGYVPQGTWWRVGFLISLLHLVLWLGVGMLWWKVLGWW